MKKLKTEKQLVVSALRSAWLKSPYRRAALKEAKHPSRSGWFICHYCGDEREKVTVDHNPPVGVLDEKFINVREYILTMFFGSQVAACKECHAQRTKEQAKQRRQKK